jgi:glycosyltransferase involved in cell wall biosynthesis
MPEVAGDAAIMIDPLNVGELADAIGSVVESNSLREQLRHLGLARAASFSWLKTACQTLKVYEQCA